MADVCGLGDEIAEADLVVTGEGRLDPQSFEGKVVGGVLELAALAGVPVVVLAGQVAGSAGGEGGPLPDGLGGDVEVLSLTGRFGAKRSSADPLGCVEEALVEELVRRGAAAQALRRR